MGYKPDRTPVENHLYSKYSDRQAGTISVDPDRKPVEYHLYSKYSDRQAGAISLIGHRLRIIYILSIWTGRQVL